MIGTDVSLFVRMAPCRVLTRVRVAVAQGCTFSEPLLGFTGSNIRSETWLPVLLAYVSSVVTVPF
jgi:hypothetical protein